MNKFHFNEHKKDTWKCDWLIGHIISIRHFKEDCPRLKKKYKDKDSKEKEKLKKKSTWKDEKKKKKKKKKVLKATWSDSSDDEKNEGIKDEEVNLCLIPNSSKGEYDISDTSTEDLQEALEDVFMKLKKH